MIIDVHNHYYPPEYLDELKKGHSTITVDEDAEGNPRVHYPGDYNIVVKGHRDIDYRQDILDQLGVTKQVITFTTPGVHVEGPALATAVGAAGQRLHGQDRARSARGTSRRWPRCRSTIRPPRSSNSNGR